MTKVPTPKGRTDTGEIEKVTEKVTSPVEETKEEVKAANKAETVEKTVDAVVETDSEEEFPQNFFGKTVKSLEEKNVAMEEFDKTIADKMANGIELSEMETGYKLSKEPKVSVFIPRTKQDPKGAAETVTINCYRYTIKKGVRALVPKSVADNLDRYLKSEEILDDSSIDNDVEKKAALD